MSLEAAREAARGLIYALVAALLAGAGVWGYRWIYDRGEAAGSARVTALERDIADRINQYNAKVAESQNEIAGLRVELADALSKIKEDEDANAAQINTVTRSDRACLSPAAGRLLRDAIARANARLEGRRGSEKPPASGAAAAASERDVTGWSNAVIAQFSREVRRHQALAGIVEAMPKECVTIREDQ